MEKGLSPKGTVSDSEASFNYDALGRRVSMIDSSGTTVYSYDALNRLTGVDGPRGNDLITYAYDKLGNRIQMNNQNTGTVNYSYDGLNRLISLTDAQGKTVTYSYDSTNNLIQKNYPNNTCINYSFDKLNRLISLVNKQNTGIISSYVYEYNPLGLRTKVTLTDGADIDYTYDGLNRLIGEYKVDSNAEAVYNTAYRYDSVGNRLIYSKTDSHRFSDDFNRANNPDIGVSLSEISGDWQIDNNRLFMPNAETDAVIIYPGSGIANAVIEATVRLETVGNKKGSYIVFGYQSKDDFYYSGLEGISDLWVMGHYQNGVYNDLITLSEPIEKLVDYRLKVIVKDNMATLENLENGFWVKKLSYNFGNLPIGKTGLSVEKSRTRFDDFKVDWQITSNIAYSYNAGNQLIQSTVRRLSFDFDQDGLSIDIETDYHYDNNGNLIKKIEGANITDYVYDYGNRLIFADAGGRSATYKYDAFGRRIQQTNPLTGQQANYIYDGTRIIAEYDATGNLIKKHIYGAGIDEILQTTDYGLSANYYYHTDGLGSITNLTNSTGQTVQFYQYDAFGNILQTQGSIPNLYTYTAREYDSEIGLYYYRNRYYDPKIGRFITQDPVGILDDINLYAYVDSVGKPIAGTDLNLYEYAHNNPINFIDPYGLWYIDINVSVGWWGGVGTGGIIIGSTGVYSYGGGGAGTPGPGFALTWSPSNPSTGWNFGAQGGFWLGGQTGIDTKKNKFWEVGFVTPSLSGTAYYVEPFKWPWQKDKKGCKK